MQEHVPKFIGPFKISHFDDSYEMDQFVHFSTLFILVYIVWKFISHFPKLISCETKCLIYLFIFKGFELRAQLCSRDYIMAYNHDIEINFS